MTPSATRLAALSAALLLAACAREPEGAPSASQVESAPLFVNGGFEDGTTSGWTITVNRTPASTGSPSGITYPPTSIASLNLRTQGTATARTYVRSTPTQQIFGLSGLASPVVPRFGDHSVVVNEGGSNYNVNTLKQAFTVTNADVDPADGKVHVRFALAPALQDPGHPLEQQPYFWAQIRNVTRNQVLFYTFNYSNQPGIPWSVQGTGQSQVRYTDWQIFDVAPGNAKLVPGEDVEITVIAAGCAQSGHWGEVAVDGFGAFLPSLSVAASAPQATNAGTNLTYTFVVKNSTVGVVPNVVVDEVLPAAFNSAQAQTGQTTFVSVNAPGATCTAPAVGASGTVSCAFGWMNPGATSTFTVTVAIPGTATGRVANGNYSVRADSVSALLGPLVETTLTSGKTYADLGVTVNDATSALVWGGPASYTLDVFNAGPAAVTGAVVNDTFPAQLTGVTWTCTATVGGSCATAGPVSGNITNQLVTLPSGAHATFTISATVAASGTSPLTHTASVAAPSGVTDSDDRNNADADVNGIGTLHLLTVQKAAGATGQGTVTSSPEGIACGTGCASASASFLAGNAITLTAVARPGDTFSGWSGACTGTANTCTVTLSGAATATAAFDGPPVNASVVGGNGTLSCQSPVAQASTSTCTITPSAGYALATLTDGGADVLAAVSGGTYPVTNVTSARTIVATFKLAQGQVCGSAGSCASGQCVDGVCCDVACDGACQACNVTGSAGTCTPVAGGPDPACAPYVCGGGGACLGTCGGDGDCAVGSWCSGGACLPKGGPGAACGAANECGSGQCVDGVCCNVACGGQCEACDVAGSVGTCTATNGAPHGARAACASDGSACGGSCNGVVTTSCSYPTATTSCRGASCAAGVGTLAAACDGAGTCPAVTTDTCAPYACGATACLETCGGDADCNATSWCSGGACLPKVGPGAACSAANQCGSGQCVDGVCCNTACAGQCEACDVAGSVGTCTATNGTPHGARAACASDGSACGGACNGTNTAACTYPTATTSCRGASCAAGVGTLAAACNGAGACPAVQTDACAPYACGTTACLETCGGDADCNAASWCSGGACVPKAGPGAACGAANECGSGQCVDGVCCNTACTGQCEACDVAGSAGTCTPVAGAPHGARSACASDGSDCGGTCNGVVTIACSFPGATTTCRSASCAAGEATLAAACDGAGACPATQTVSCAPFTCGASACRGDCAVDGDCAAGSWCGGGVCQAKKGPGQSCGGDGQCGSGFCVDGLCCDQACGGQCEACDVPGSAGTCTAVAGAPHGARSACESDGSACGGACNGSNTGACAYPTVACRAGSCDAGVATVAAACDGGGHCPAVQTVSCSPYLCGPTSCEGDCTVDADCAAGSWCAAGVCTPEKEPGQACGAASECASGSCVDGVCCDTACDGQCEACDAAGTVGTCSPVPGAPRGARPACAADGSACGGACDGTHGATCAYPAAETTCRTGACAAGVATVAAACDGAGHCPAEQAVSCNPYVCGAAACLGDCDGDADCAGDHYCAAGVCTPRKGPGQACGGAAQCASGSCVDGVCCDSACTGQCEACDVAGSVGTCSAVTGAPHAARTTCATDGSACAGACDGAVRTACAYPGATTTCRAPSCADGVATVAATCGGAGSCPALVEQTCAPYACGADACLTSCGGDGDCADGFTCQAGQCLAGADAADLTVAGSGCGSGGSPTGPLALLALLLLVPGLRRRAPAPGRAAGRRATRLGLGLALLLAPLAVRAQADAPSFEVERFRPEGGARDVLGVPSASVPGHLQKSLSAWLSYADQPLRLMGTGTGAFEAPLVSSQTTLQLGGSIGLLDRFEVAAVVPLTVASGDRPAGLSGVVSLPQAGAAVGDLGLTPKAHLADLGPLGLAIAAPLKFPTGARSAYAGQGGVTGGLEALAEWRAPHQVRALASAGWVQRGERKLVDLTVGPAMTWGLAAEVPLPVRLAGRPVVAMSTLSGELGFGNGSTARPMELLLAARARLPLGLDVTLGAGPGLGSGYGTPRFRVVASVAFASRAPAAPATPAAAAPEPAPVVVAAAEPPPAPPPQAAPPAEPPPAEPVPPIAADPPPAPEPLPAPPAPQVVVTSERLVILQQVHFANDRDVILADSFPLLEEVARVLVANPQITRLRVEGHTDSKGKPSHNTLLSERRAVKVRGFLLERGVAEGRVEAKGFGPERPIAPNATAQGRARNRRVEFVIVEQDG